MPVKKFYSWKLGLDSNEAESPAGWPGFSLLLNLKVSRAVKREFGPLYGIEIDGIRNTIVC